MPFSGNHFDQGTHNPQNIATFLFVFSLSILFLLYDPVLIRVGGLNLLVLIVLVMTNSCVFDNYHIIIYHSAHVLYKLQSVKNVQGFASDRDFRNLDLPYFRIFWPPNMTST